MSKNMSTAAAQTAPRHGLQNVRTLVSCALLAAVSVVLARFIIPMPNETTRFSLEAVPIFLAGMLFGPLPARWSGSWPILSGVCSPATGITRCSACRPFSMVWPPVCSSRCSSKRRPSGRSRWRSCPPSRWARSCGRASRWPFVYGGDAKTAFFLTKLASRSIQLGVTFVIDVAVVWLLYRSKVFTAAKLWPPVKYEKKSET